MKNAFSFLTGLLACKKVIDIKVRDTDTKYVIEGIKTTIPFHQQLMRNEAFRSGNFNTKFLESFKMV